MTNQKQSCINVDIDCRDCAVTIGDVIKYVENEAEEQITEWSSRGTPCESVVYISFGQTELKEMIGWSVDNTDYLIDEQNHEEVYESVMYLLAIQMMRKKYCMYL